jgi:hypothetical protein
MPVKEETPQKSPGATRSRVFQAGKKHFEDLTRISRTCQLAPPTGSLAGARDGRCSSRWITIGEFSNIPQATGGRERVGGTTGTCTVIYAPSGAIPAEDAGFLARAQTMLGTMQDGDGVAGGGGVGVAVPADAEGMVAAGLALVQQLQGQVDAAVAREDPTFFTRAAQLMFRLAQPEVPVVGRVLHARTEPELVDAWKATAVEFKDLAALQPPSANQLQHGELAQGAPAAPEFPEEGNPLDSEVAFPLQAVPPHEPAHPPAGGEAPAPQIPAQLQDAPAPAAPALV